MKILYFNNAMEIYGYIWGGILQNKNFTVMNVLK